MHFLLAASSGGGLGALGLNFGSLIFQLINFGILYWVLKKYAFPPLVRLLDRRRKLIEASLKDAEAASRARREAEERRSEVLSQARDKARQIIHDARAEAEHDAARIMEEARQTANATVEAADRRIATKATNARRQLLAEIGEVVATATAEVTRGELTPKADDALIRQVLKQEESRV